jgi:hypothetical protein
MKSKIIFTLTLIFSCFILTGCTPKTEDNIKTNKPTPEINQETGNEPEEDLLKELNSTSNDDYDSELNQIEAEIK